MIHNIRIFNGKAICPYCKHTNRFKVSHDKYKQAIDQPDVVNGCKHFAGTMKKPFEGQQYAIFSKSGLLLIVKPTARRMRPWMTGKEKQGG